MPTLVEDLTHLPAGSHCLSLHANQKEAADHAIEFLAGAPEGQSASYWVHDSTLATYYNERLVSEAPEHVGCVHFLPTAQVHETEAGLRPVEAIESFVSAHPEGVTGGADTITRYWGPESVPEYLDYEAWFDSLPREGSRFICPYDLRHIPATQAVGILRVLGAHHTHAVLSDSEAPAVRLLQLFIFPTAAELPAALEESLGWAIRNGWVEMRETTHELELTPAGSTVVEEWARKAVIDW